jgi:ABC-2 type transport system permease protein
MNRLESIFRLGMKELVSLSRDVAMVGLVIYAFTYAVYGPAKGAHMELRNASVAIVDEDHSMLSARLGDALTPPLFQRPQYLDRSQLDAALDAGRFTFVIDVPPRFQSDVQARRQPAIQLNIDATAMSQAGRGAGYIDEILNREIAAFVAAPTSAAAARLVVRAKFNPNLSDTWFLGIAQIIDNITLLALILSGAAVVREREHGTLEHLLVLPLRPSDIMLAKIAANGVAIVIVAILSVKIVVEGLLQVPVAGSLGVFAVVATLYLFAISSLGILLATTARSMPQFGLLAFLVYLVLNMLSGGVTPLDSMPEWLQSVLQISPTTHFFNAAFAVLYRGAGIGSVAYDVLAMVAIGSVFFTIALLMFRRTLSATALAGA